jgi:predicted component of type VI protein secretion system
MKNFMFMLMAVGMMMFTACGSTGTQEQATEVDTTEVVAEPAVEADTAVEAQAADTTAVQ